MRDHLRSALTWMDPRKEIRGLRWIHVPFLGVGVAALVKLLLIVGLIGTTVAVYGPAFWHQHHIRITQSAPLTKAQTSTLLSVKPADEVAATCFQPGPKLFRLPRTYAIISSRYDYDYNLIESTPCQDTDMMQPQWTHQRLTLPGPSWTRYTFLWTLFADGSGYYSAWVTPNGGRIAFLHVVNPQPFRAGQKVRGGTYIGLSGWPGSFLFSNGSCGSFTTCGGDAHMCLVTSATGADWLYRLTYSPPKKPAPKFPVKAWNAWANGHHKHPIPYKAHGKLTWAASIWLHHRGLRGVKGAGSFHRGHPGYDRYPFSKGIIYAFPKPGTYKIVWNR